MISLSHLSLTRFDITGFFIPFLSLTVPLQSPCSPPYRFLTANCKEKTLKNQRPYSLTDLTAKNIFFIFFSQNEKNFSKNAKKSVRL